MNRITIAGIALLVLGLGKPKVASAMVEVPTLTEMIEASEAICFVELREIQPWKMVAWWTYERNRVEVLKTLKWSGAPAEEIVVVPRRFEGGMEDPPAQFPPVGGRALVFLHRNDEGDWAPSNSIFGLWEWSMESNSFQGGWSVPLEYLEQAVACLSDPATKTECMERLNQRPSENGLLPANGIGVGNSGDDASADAEADAIVPAPPLPATVPETPAPAPRHGCGCSVPGESHAAGGALGLSPLLLLSVPPGDRAVLADGPDVGRRGRPHRIERMSLGQRVLPAASSRSADAPGLGGAVRSGHDGSGRKLDPVRFHLGRDIERRLAVRGLACLRAGVARADGRARAGPTVRVLVSPPLDLQAPKARRAARVIRRTVPGR